MYKAIKERRNVLHWCARIAIVIANKDTTYFEFRLDEDDMRNLNRKKKVPWQYLKRLVLELDHGRRIKVLNTAGESLLFCRKLVESR